MTDRNQQLKEAIAAQERLRGTIPDDIIDTTIATLRARLAASSPAHSPAQQRKLVTVLFADASGFTAMSETMDAEDVVGMINAYWTRLDRIIQEHRGRIDKHMGDGVMALWGAEQSREDDPELAVRAALAMQEELAKMNSQQENSLAMRIGISTGPVLLGEIGLTQEYTAMGDTVNLASRLEQAAPAGGVLISHDTYRHVRGAFDVQALGSIAVKGKAQPVQAYRVVQARPHAFRMGRRGVRGVTTRMIGREAELAQLQSALQTAIDHNLTRVITVVGEAGIGKSRLLYEFERWIDSWFERPQYFKGRAFPEGQNQPYSLLRDLFAFHFRVQEDDPVRAVQEKLEQGITAVFGMQERAKLQAHFIARLLGFDFPDSPYLSGVRQDPQQ
ncbi:MAG: AAA family ATPase, partial [Anaerolineae bacterium]|nr:AAA family ATPase [Anaerolineae bacterium]